MKATLILVLAGLATLAACDGPREDAGEQVDNATGAVRGEDNVRSGPAETLGERRDDTADSAEDAREARADALEDAADEQREAADQRADALEDDARATRGQTK